MVEKDNSSKKKWRIFKTLASVLRAFSQSKPRIPMAINSLKNVHTRTNTPFFLMICSHMLFCVESLLHSASPSLFLLLFHITFVCYSLCEYFSSEPLSEFWQRPFYIWTDSKRGKCKTLYQLLNSITTWETSVRYLHFMASVSPFDKQSNRKLVDAQGSNWRVLAVCIVMQMEILHLTFLHLFLKNKMGKVWI